MANHLNIAIQDLDLGIEDAPVALPLEDCAEAAHETQFTLIGRPLIPRRQNIRHLISALPRQWGFSGVINGRIVDRRRFQFIFPSEESLLTVMHRGPWAFVDHMLVIQRWSPQMDLLDLNFIPFWIQIRGIPLQFMTKRIIRRIGEQLGDVVEVDFHGESAIRVQFARVRVNWNVDNPLRFQRQFQFSPGVNTVLRFTYERLRGLCSTCGMLTHEPGACLVMPNVPQMNPEPSDSEPDNDGRLELMDGSEPNGFQ